MNHRTDPRTMEERWRSMGYAVEWDDGLRCYAMHAINPSGWYDAYEHYEDSVDDVEAWVVAHREVQP